MRKDQLRKQILAILFFSIFLLSAVASARATVTIESTIEDNIYVIVKLENLDQTLYTDAKANLIFNGSAITRVITQNLQKENRTNVTYDVQANTYDDANRAIGVSFHLGGADIMTSTINRTSLKRSFHITTDWRKFQINLTSSMSIDFATYFAESVGKWQRIDYRDSSGNLHPAYYYETAEITQLGKMSFRFSLPSTATNAQAKEDTITYDMPLGFEDVLLSSPFPILAAIIVVVLIALIYQRIR
jgi:hypothetical protein